MRRGDFGTGIVYVWIWIKRYNWIDELKPGFIGDNRDYHISGATTERSKECPAKLKGPDRCNSSSLSTKTRLFLRSFFLVAMGVACCFANYALAGLHCIVKTAPPRPHRRLYAITSYRLHRAKGIVQIALWDCMMQKASWRNTRKRDRENTQGYTEGQGEGKTEGYCFCYGAVIRMRLFPWLAQFCYDRTIVKGY